MIVNFENGFNKKQQEMKEIASELIKNLSDKTKELLKLYSDNPSDFLLYSILMSMKEDEAIEWENQDDFISIIFCNKASTEENTEINNIISINEKVKKKQESSLNKSRK